MLATHREYIRLLREEIESVEQESNESEVPLNKLRLMDSFLRETSRMNPIDGCKLQTPYMRRCQTLLYPTRALEVHEDVAEKYLLDGLSRHGPWPQTSLKK